MRILVALVHYFAGSDDRKHSSTDERQRASRKLVVSRVVEAYRGLFGRPATLEHASRSYHLGPGGDDQVDIAIVTMPERSLFDPAFCARHNATMIEVSPDNPRALGFHAHELFARMRHDYDLFVYSEDDLRPSDPDMFAKLAWFNARHGGTRLLSPNRFEWSADGTAAIKTHIDGDLRDGLVDPLIALVPDRETIEDEVLGRRRLFRRARNPHSGFFAVTQAQLGYWMRQPHWLDRDVSFVSPLESAATLGVCKTFAIYKPHGASVDFLEIQHMDNRFSRLRLPVTNVGLEAALPPA